MNIPKIVGISTCKGRLDHIKETSRKFLEEKSDNVHYLLVDYGCPQKSGQWLIDNLGNTGRAKSLIINPISTKFHKTIALNAGAKYAITNMDAEYLLFFDADSYIEPGFIDKIIPILSGPDRFIFVDPIPETKDLTGLLILHQKLFRESGGFEESFRDWGAEDLEYRLRLYEKYKKPFDLVNGDFLGSISHDNDLRTIFYNEKNPCISNNKNTQRMRKMFALYRGEDLRYWRKFKDRKYISKLLGHFDSPVENIIPNTKTGMSSTKNRF